MDKNNEEIASFTISMPKELLEYIDAEAQSNYKSRSAYIRDLVLADKRQPKLL